MGADPYADLLERFRARQKEYLRRITTDDETFKEEPVANGVATRRGFVKGKGPRPQCTLTEQDAAAVAADDNHYFVVWTDSPCLRASVSDPWEIDDLRGAIARLSIYRDPQSFDAAIPVPEPPHEDTVGLRFRQIKNLVSQLAAYDRRSFRNKIRALLGPALVEPTGLPTRIVSAYDDALIEEVVEKLDDDIVEPDPSDQAKLTELTDALAALTLQFENETLGAEAARDILVGLYRLLPSETVIKLVHAVVENGTITPEDLPFGMGAVGSSGGAQVPYVPLNVWAGIATLSQFGRYEIADGNPSTVRNTVLAVARWCWAPPWTLPEVRAVDGHAKSLIQELFGHLWVPEGFAWPDFDRRGIYWWRSVIHHHCQAQCYELNETADFHSTDLLRLLYLFAADDVRIPDYVRIDAQLALIWFKYAWDEPPAKKPEDKTDKAEMTTWSENHQILFAQSQLLAGALFRNRTFPRTGESEPGKARTGQIHVQEAIPRVERWLDHRLRFGFSEWNAPGYYNEDFTPLFNLVDFCPAAAQSAADAQEAEAFRRIKVKAAQVLDLLVFDCARFTCRGSFAVTSGRSYWEQKGYGWEQSIGNTIEILFGTRGDFMSSEPAAVALATSSYDVPEALLAIGIDRVVRDQSKPFKDRTRVSIDFDEASSYGIGFESEEDILFWWGNAAYFDHTLDATKRIVAAHDNLRLADPFSLLYAISDQWLKEFFADVASWLADAIQTAGGSATIAALPFPLSLVAVGLEGKNIFEGFVNLFKDAWDAVKTVVDAIGHWLGLGDDKPEIPDTALQAILEKMLVAFNEGTVLSRADIVTYSNGDAMLSSVQNHLVGKMAFQKQPWMANLGLEACVWTQARFMKPDLGSYIDGAERFLGHFLRFHIHEAAIDVLAPPAMQAFGHGDLFGHDGPNYWTGSLALPMIVQHENAAIICYSIPDLQRDISGASTHAWFPRDFFDSTSKEDANGGTWFFGQKDHFGVDPASGAETRLGSGYVALFTAKEADWTNESGNVWNNKEIMTFGGSNIWVCMIGSQIQFGSFDTFRHEVLNSYLNVSGVGSLKSLECSFDIPRASAPAGRAPRLELFYDDRTGRFAGDDIDLQDFPRFENDYVTQFVAHARGGTGIHPQVETLTSENKIAFGSTGYTISHPGTGLSLEHDTKRPFRLHTTQQQQQTRSAPRRLQDGDLAPIRRRRPMPTSRHALGLEQIRRRPK